MPRQDSLTDQIKDVLKHAEAAGCYDAADWIRDAWNAPNNEHERPEGEEITRV
jgi:hypothetical protein